MGIEKLFMRLYPVLGIASVAYYIVCVIYAWAGVSWLWIWLALALFCFLRHAMLCLEIKGKLRFPKIIRMLYRFVFIAAVGFFAVVEYAIVKDMDAEPVDRLEYIVVLGAAVRGEEPTTPLLLRMDTARRYMEDNPATFAIASGGRGKGEDISEAECIRRYLTENGIQYYRIVTEDGSNDTEENLKNSLGIIGDSNVRVGIVTNSFHMFRAMLLANRLGYRNVVPVPAPTLMPLGIHYTVREFFAVCEIWLASFA